MGILSRRTSNAEGILGVVYGPDYGVKADGADDLAAIKAAISTALALGAGVVELPPGTVTVGGSIPLPSNIELRIPTGCTLKLADGANTDVITNADPTNGNNGIRITGGGTIDGNRANQTTAGRGVNLTKCSDAVIGSVTVQNCYQSGVLLTSCLRPIFAGTVGASNGTHGVHLSGTTFANGMVTARDNGQVAAGDGLYLDAASTDNTLSLIATDTRSGASKTQLYGAVEAPASGCDRNLISGSLSGNATGTASLIGTSSKVVNTVAVVASGVNPQPIANAASAGTALQAAPLDHVHAAGSQSIPNAALAADVARANLLVNGGVELWQRGAGAFNNAYTADRWQILLGGTSTISVSQETTAVDVSSAAALKAVYAQGTANSQIDQKLEGYQQLRGKLLSFSVRVRQGVASNVRPYISDSGAKTYGVASATTGGYVTLTVTLAIGAGSTGVNVGIDLGASDTAYMDNAMLCISPVAVNYVPLTPAEEWARCQRYYEVHGGSSGFPAAYGVATGVSNVAVSAVPYHARKAVAPTLTLAGTWNVLNTNQPTLGVSTVDGYKLLIASLAAGQMYAEPNSTDDLVIAESNP